MLLSGQILFVKCYDAEQDREVSSISAPYTNCPSVHTDLGNSSICKVKRCRTGQGSIEYIRTVHELPVGAYRPWKQFDL